jgi:hypothetical protein
MSRRPSLKSIFAAAAKSGIAVRVDYGSDGKIASIVTTGKILEAHNDGEPDTNPWDDVLHADKKRAS